jgi:hypothetical protein
MFKIFFLMFQACAPSCELDVIKAGGSVHGYNTFGITIITVTGGIKNFSGVWVVISSDRRRPVNKHSAFKPAKACINSLMRVCDKTSFSVRSGDLATSAVVPS